MNDALLISTYRHWIWSDRMKELFEFYLANEEPQVDIMASDFFLSSIGTCMWLWYALLYATCEGLQAGKVNVAEEIDPTYRTWCNKLRLFRNAAFHVQEHLEPSKFTDVLRSEEIVPVIRGLHQNVGEYLARHIAALPSYREGVERANRPSEST